MRKLLFLIAFLPLLATAQDNSKKFKLSGQIKNLPDSAKVEWVFIQYRTGEESKSDSTKPKNGKYNFSANIAEPVLARLRVKFAETSPGKRPAINYDRDIAQVFLEPGKQKVLSTDSFSHVKVKSSAAHAEYAKLNEQTKPYNDKMEVLYTKYSEYRKANDKKNQAKTDTEIEAINDEMREKVYGEYVKKNESSPVAVYALQEFAGWVIDAEKVDPLYNLLPEALKKSPSAISLKESIETARKTGIGKVAMEFTQNDTLDKPVSLSAFRGKYVLIDFWASWCGPCRAENPNVLVAYNKFKDKNFHIIGVSLDRPGQKEKWLKAIHDDGLIWTQVSDLKFWDNAVAKQYGIQSIPQNFLLDPDGKIIAKNLRGDDLEQKLGEAIDAKKAF